MHTYIHTYIHTYAVELKAGVPFLSTEAPISQKAREGCGCFRGLFGSPEESSGKVPGKLLMLEILGFRATGKANLPGTLGRHCLDLVPASMQGVF